MSRQNESPEEAKVAALRAQEILQKYDMSISEVEIKQEGFENCSEHAFKLGKIRIPSWVKILHADIAESFDIKAIRCKYDQGTDLLFLGIEPDVTIAKQTFEYLYQFVNAHDYSGLDTSARYDWRLGFVTAVSGRLQRKKKEQTDNTHITALVLCKNQIADDFVSSKYSRILEVKTKLRDVGSSYFDGYQVGKKIPINRPLDTLDINGRIQ
jgi:hypothetical protein